MKQQKIRYQEYLTSAVFCSIRKPEAKKIRIGIGPKGLLAEPGAEDNKYGKENNKAIVRKLQNKPIKLEVWYNEKQKKPFYDKKKGVFGV